MKKVLYALFFIYFSLIYLVNYKCQDNNNEKSKIHCKDVVKPKNLSDCKDAIAYDSFGNKAFCCFVELIDNNNNNICFTSGGNVINYSNKVSIKLPGMKSLEGIITCFKQIHKVVYIFIIIIYAIIIY